PPAVTMLACKALSTLELPSGILLALEKPFGTDLATAKSLNRRLQKMLPEHQLFRVDHFLG
ncbi:MAG: glucose-6-phosphate dehydrogenase, partial [Rhodoglobus sp.]|nr:glucose-6-phosphate dehydrogenase [Rhodoglobus sp.]